MILEFNDISSNHSQVIGLKVLLIKYCFMVRKISSTDPIEQRLIYIQLLLRFALDILILLLYFCMSTLASKRNAGRRRKKLGNSHLFTLWQATVAIFITLKDKTLIRSHHTVAFFASLLKQGLSSKANILLF